MTTIGNNNVCGFACLCDCDNDITAKTQHTHTHNWCVVCTHRKPSTNGRMNCACIYESGTSSPSPQPPHINVWYVWSIRCRCQLTKCRHKHSTHRLRTHIVIYTHRHKTPISTIKDYKFNANRRNYVSTHDTPALAYIRIPNLCGANCYCYYHLLV